MTGKYKGLFAFVALLLSLASGRVEALGLPRAGFYEVEGGDSLFGRLVHLRAQDTLDPRFPGKILKAVRGTFGRQGEITTYFGDDGAGRPYWYDQVLGKSGWLTLTDSGGGGLTMEDGSRGKKLRLRFAGTRAPSEEASGIRTRYLQHRGFSYFPPYNSEGIYPANTLPAMRAALEAGYGGFEFDVRVSSDGRFAVSHDGNLPVATTCEGSVHEKTLDELRQCYVNGSTFIPDVVAVRTPTMARMPSLHEVLARFAADPRFEHMVIDVKPDADDRLVGAFLDAIGPFLGQPEYLAKILVIVHSDQAIQAMRRIDPWSRYFLEGPIGIEPLEGGADFFPEAHGGMRWGHDAISMNVGLAQYVPPLLGMQRIAGLLGLARAYDYPVMGWTVSTDFELAATRDALPGLDFLLTDAPMGVLARLEIERYSRLFP